MLRAAIRLVRTEATVGVRAFASTPVKIHSDAAPAAVGPYSQAVAANGIIWVSGQLPIDPKTGKFNSDTDVALQTAQCLKNMEMTLKAGNSNLDHVVKTTILLADMADFPKVNEVYASFFKKLLPARATYAVKGLPKGALVEIEAVAVVAK